MRLGEHAAGPIARAVGVDAEDVTREGFGVGRGDPLEHQVGDDVGENPVAGNANGSEVNGGVDVPIHRVEERSIAEGVGQVQTERG